MFQFRVSKLLAGEGVRTAIGTEVRKFGVSKVVLITGVNTGKTAFCNDVINSIVNEGIDISIWDEVCKEPDESTVNLCYEFVQREKPEAIVAFGGGSVIDTAKLVNLCFTVGKSLKSALKFLRCPLILKPMFMIPTTFGTGSETTCAAVVSVDGTKRGILHKSFLPTLAILDWEIKAPKAVAASAGMDAIMHAFEAYTTVSSDQVEGNFYSGSNEVTDTLAVKSLKMLKNLPEYVKNGCRAREVALGSNMAGMAFGNAGVHFGHAASYAIASVCNAPHGVCVASVGQALLEWLKKLEDTRYKVKKVEEILNIDEVRRNVGLPSLSEIGIELRDVPTLVKKTMEVKRLIAMRPEIDENAAREIFESALSY